MKKVLIAAILATLPHQAFATDVDCSTTCSGNEVLVSFADGPNVTCQCIAPAVAMNEAPVDNGEGTANTNPEAPDA